jgi:patatin-like phospholipase/acyl hydrolase
MNVSQRPVRILSIDGGGIRGIIPALVLTYIEVTTQRSISDMFDVIVGTSTGGILALGLTVPHANGGPAFSALDLTELYPQWGKKIFPSGGEPTVKERFLGRGDTFFERMGNAARVAGAPFGGNPKFGGSARHGVQGLEQALQHYFKDVTLAQALTEVAVTSFDTTHGTPFVFTRREARTYPLMNFEMHVAARATSAAPTFLPPQNVRIGEEVSSLIDGGVWANNPVMVGYLEALRLTVERKLTADSVYIVSLGTGSSPATGGQFSIAANWLSAFKDLASIATDTNINDASMRRHFPTAENRYWRLQSFDAAAVGSMDDPTPERIDSLMDAAVALIQERKVEIDGIVKNLVALASAQ